MKRKKTRQEVKQLNELATSRAEFYFKRFHKLLQESRRQKPIDEEFLSTDMIRWIAYSYQWGWWDGFQNGNLQCKYNRSIEDD
jgi:hypothetical protein